MQIRTTNLNKLSFFLITFVLIFSVLAYGTVHQPILAVFYLAMSTLLLLWAADSLKSGAARFSTSMLQAPLFLFGIYGLFQTIPFGYVSDLQPGLLITRTISVEPYSTQMTAVHILFLCVYFAAALLYIDRVSRIRKMILILTAFGLMYSFYAILQSILSPNKIYGIYEPGSATPFGSFVNRHNFAAIMEMTIAIPLGVLFTGAVERHQSMLYWVATGLMGTALLLSGSRGGLVSLAVGLIFIAILTVRIKGRSGVLLSTVSVAAILFIALAGAVFVGGDTSLTRFTDATASTSVSSSRTEIWKVSLDTIAANLPLGAGIGAFPQAYTQQDTASGAQRVEQSHNDYLQVIADAGIVGGVLGGAFLLLFFRLGFRNITNTDPLLRGAALGAFSGCFIILVHSLFDFVLHITAVSLMFLVLIALLVASGREIDEDHQGSRIKKRGKKPVRLNDLQQVKRGV